MSTYLGHLSADFLREHVEAGHWLTINRERHVMHYQVGLRKPMVGRRKLGAPFAACAKCGTFAEVSYILGREPYCSARCVKSA